MPNRCVCVCVFVYERERKRERGAKMKNKLKVFMDMRACDRGNCPKLVYQFKAKD